MNKINAVLSRVIWWSHDHHQMLLLDMPETSLRSLPLVNHYHCPKIGKVAKTKEEAP
jgi:hypothetical protein